MVKLYISLFSRSLRLLFSCINLFKESLLLFSLQWLELQGVFDIMFHAMTNFFIASQYIGSRSTLTSLGSLPWRSGGDKGSVAWDMHALQPCLAT